MVDDPDTSALAGLLADHAVKQCGDPVLALLAVMQAAGAICLVRMQPAAFAIDAFDGAAKLTHDKLVSMLGPEKVRQ